MSPLIQNALLSCVGQLVKETVVGRIKSAIVWTIIGDETTDRQRREQLAVIIRYPLVDELGKWRCYEDPVAIVGIMSLVKRNSVDEKIYDHEIEQRLSGKAIGLALLRIVNEIQLDLRV